MIYQSTFQAEEQPALSQVSYDTYHGDKDGSYPAHCHAYYEISYIKAGKRYETYGGKRYEAEADCLFFIPPLTIHSLQNREPVNDLVVQFSMDFLTGLAPGFSKNILLEPADPSHPYLILQYGSEEQSIVYELIDILETEKAVTASLNASPEKKLCESYLKTSLVSKLMSLLLEKGFLQLQEGTARQSQLMLLDGVINQLLTHPQEKLDMAQAARMTGMSYYRFSRFFPSVTGFGYTDYCNLLRIRHSEELLIHTTLSVGAIAESIGIDTASYFTRLFKKANGISPLKYRQKYQNL